MFEFFCMYFIIIFRPTIALSCPGSQFENPCIMGYSLAPGKMRTTHKKNSATVTFNILYFLLIASSPNL